MRKRGRLAALLLACSPFTAISQNLLTNPGFDRDLAGWGYETEFYPLPQLGGPHASAVWSGTDAAGLAGSGSVRFWLSGGPQSIARATLTQCVPVEPATLYAVGGVFKILHEMNTSISLRVDYFPASGCPAANLGHDGWEVLGSPCPRSSDSGGAWFQAFYTFLSPADARSALVSVQVYAVTSFWCGSSDVDGLADDLFFESVEPASVPWLLPTSARVPGVNGSLWTTDLVLSNRNPTGAFATVKLLGHDVDGRNAEQRTLYVSGLQTRTVKDVLGSLFLRTVDYGALLFVASPGLAVVAGNTTPVGGACGRGGVGESLPALGPSELVGAAAKALFPIRENDAFRTNLVLANASGFPITVRLQLVSPAGEVLGAGEVDLPPLGMKQINRVAVSLGASGVDGGRLEVSTDTPEAFFAAYASLIDNATNDPRALLPR